MVKKNNCRPGPRTDANPIEPNKTRKVSQAFRHCYRDLAARKKMPLSHFLEGDRDYPYRTPDGRIDCNAVSAAIKRARLNKGAGVRGSAATLKKAQRIWNRVCKKFTDGASQ